MKLTTETQRAAGAAPAPSDSPIQAPGGAIEGPRPSAPGSTIRTCACGCGGDLTGRRPNVRYAVPAHRTRKWREARENAGKASPKRHKPSGLQVSYLQAVEGMAETLVMNRWRPDDARRVAEITMRDRLSDRQRARLDARTTTRAHAREEGTE